MIIKGAVNRNRVVFQEERGSLAGIRVDDSKAVAKSAVKSWSEEKDDARVTLSDGHGETHYTFPSTRAKLLDRMHREQKVKRSCSTRRPTPDLGRFGTFPRSTFRASSVCV